MAMTLPHPGSYRPLEAVKFALLEWVDLFNYRRLLESIGNVPRAELEMQYFRQCTRRQSRSDSMQRGSGKAGAVHFCRSLSYLATATSSGMR